MAKAFIHTIGQVIDSLKYGQVAESEMGTYLTRKAYGFIWCEKDGTYHENNYLRISDITLDLRWNIL